MGMIASLKVGYKSIILTFLLSIFDKEGGFDAARQAQARHKPGCQGLSYGVKPHILDVMEILANIWNKDINYARSDEIQRCWSKAYILPAFWNTDINNDVGSASLPEWDNNMGDKDCDNICRMLKIMCVKVNKSNSDTNIAAYEFQGSFFEDLDTNGLKDMLWEDMAHNWIGIEDDLDIINGEIDEAMEEMEDDRKDYQEDNNNEEIPAPQE